MTVATTPAPYTVLRALEVDTQHGGFIQHPLVIHVPDTSHSSFYPLAANDNLGFATTGIPDRPEPLIHRFGFNDLADFQRLLDTHPDSGRLRLDHMQLLLLPINCQKTSQDRSPVCIGEW